MNSHARLKTHKRWPSKYYPSKLIAFFIETIIEK